MLAGIWVNNVGLFIHLSSDEIEEVLLLGASISLTLSCLSAGGFSLGFLSHFEVCVKQAEGSNDEHDEEIHDLEGNISLLLEISPLFFDTTDKNFGGRLFSLIFVCYDFFLLGLKMI